MVLIGRPSIGVGVIGAGGGGDSFTLCLPFPLLAVVVVVDDDDAVGAVRGGDKPLLCRLILASSALSPPSSPLPPSSLSEPSPVDRTMLGDAARRSCSGVFSVEFLRSLSDGVTGDDAVGVSVSLFLLMSSSCFSKVLAKDWSFFQSVLLEDICHNNRKK